MTSVRLGLLLNKWKDSGRVYHDYPRAKKVSLSGKPRISHEAAIRYLENFFKGLSHEQQ
jgi:hypothetical protein